MALRRTHTYAKAYSFGTDGSAALAGSPISSRRPLDAAPRRNAIRRQGLRMRAYLLVMILVVVMGYLMILLVSVHAKATQAAKQTAALRMELTQIEEAISILEVKIAEQNDPQRIHTIAVNRLHMRQPTEDQIHIVPRPYVQASGPPADQAEKGAEADIGLLAALFRLMGL